MAESAANNRRIAKNTFILYARMLLMTCIGLYTSRVVLNSLGVVDYGLYNVVGGVVYFFEFINSAMSASSLRFITFAIGRGNNQEINEIFSLSLIIHAAIAILVLLLAETIGLWFVIEKMIIPAERLQAALWVYQCSVLTTMVAILSVPYNSLIIAYEKMSAFAYISLFDVILKLLIAWTISMGSFDRLILYAILILCVQVGIRICYSFYCNKKFEVSKFHLCKNGKTFREMVGFSFWTMNGCLAMVGVTQGINILLNLFFGPAVNAARGIALQVQSKLYSLCSNFQMAVRPQITKMYAQRDLNNMYLILMRTSKYSYCLMLFFSLPLMFNISVLLKWWLGVVPAYTAEFVIAMLVGSMIRSIADPLTYSIHATGKIKTYQLWEGTMLLLVVPIGYLCLKFYNIDPVMLIVIYLLIEMLTQVVRILIVLPQIGLPITEYIHQVIIKILLVTTFSIIISFLFSRLVCLDGLLYVVMSSLICAITVGFLVITIGCNHIERNILFNIVKTRICKGRKK